MKNFTKLLSASVLCTVLASSSVYAEDDIAVSALPEVVTKGIMDQFPSAKLIKAEKETDDGKVKYEVDIQADGKRKEVDVSPEGKILKVDDEG